MLSIVGLVKYTAGTQSSSSTKYKEFVGPKSCDRRHAIVTAPHASDCGLRLEHIYNMRRVNRLGLIMFVLIHDVLEEDTGPRLRNPGISI